jgi:hypothetical protein
VTPPVDRTGPQGGIDSSGAAGDRPTEGEPGLDVPPAAGADDPPPFLGSWSRLYALVIGFLALTIVLLGWLTRSFR